VLLDRGQRFAAVPRLDRLEPRPGQHPHRQPAYRLLIVDNQDGVPAGRAIAPV
jgi:histidinol phosphatase-like enzyme